jgi:AcrR family transcriptional regulator
MSTTPKRRYDSSQRADAAGATKAAILDAARALFSDRGIDGVTISQIADRAGVAGSTVYAAFKSKDGLLRALMRASLFGPGFRAAQTLLEGVDDPVRLVALTPRVARAVYESESAELGFLRGASSFSPALKKLEQEFETIRYDMQRDRLASLRDAGRMRRDISFDEARRIMWMYTSRDVYRMLVLDGGWTPDRYQDWLSGRLVDALVDQQPEPDRAGEHATP